MESGPSRLVSSPLNRLGSKEAEMQMIGCDLHARQQTLAILDTATGTLEQRVIEYTGNNVRSFYSALEGPVCVGIEATGGSSN